MGPSSAPCIGLQHSCLYDKHDGALMMGRPEIALIDLEKLPAVAPGVPPPTT